MTRLYMASAIAKDRLPTAATASFEVDRYTAVGKNLREAWARFGVRSGMQGLPMCCLTVSAVCLGVAVCAGRTYCLRVANAWYMTALAANTDSVIYLRRDSIVAAAPGASCKHLQITTTTVSSSFLPMSCQIKLKHSSCNKDYHSTAC